MLTFEPKKPYLAADNEILPSQKYASNPYEVCSLGVFFQALTIVYTGIILVMINQTKN